MRVAGWRARPRATVLPRGLAKVVIDGYFSRDGRRVSKVPQRMQEMGRGRKELGCPGGGQSGTASKIKQTGETEEERTSRHGVETSR